MKRTASSIEKAAPVCRRRGGRPLARALALIGSALLLIWAPLWVRGDQVEMQNGDRYVGHVLALNTNALVLHSEVLGTVRLPRSKVAVITFGPVQATNSPALPLATNAGMSKPAAAVTNAASGGPLVLKGMSVHTNLIQQVQQQFLSDAGPEANAKFNELLGGLLSGKLSVDDIRAQAKTAADQLRALQRESGEDGGFGTSVYLSILDHFLKETAPSGSATNGPGTSPKSTAAPTQPDE